jgi:hypothetical protein
MERKKIIFFILGAILFLILIIGSLFYILNNTKKNDSQNRVENGINTISNLSADTDNDITVTDTADLVGKNADDPASAIDQISKDIGKEMEQLDPGKDFADFGNIQ